MHYSNPALWKHISILLLFMCFVILITLLSSVQVGSVYSKDKNVKRALQKHPQDLNALRRAEEVHIKRRTPYPPRKNMGPCPKFFGKVSVLVAYAGSTMKTHYRVAQQSLQCYLKGVNYTLIMVDLEKDERVKKKCSKNKQLLFIKHCAAMVYLPETDWMLVLDADTGVVNPNHCIEEYIDSRADVLLYERFFNWEIASGNYLVRNSAFGLNFLKAWSNWEFTQSKGFLHGSDNAALQIHVLKTLIPDATQEIDNCDRIWRNATDFNTYMSYVSCVKQALGATRLWPGKVRIYRRAHGWVRDGWLNDDRWSDVDFMLHGWKQQNVGEKGWSSPFKQNINPSKCGVKYSGWNWIPTKRVNTSVIRSDLASAEKYYGSIYANEARNLMYISMPDVGRCYPDCDKST